VDRARAVDENRRGEPPASAASETRAVPKNVRLEDRPDGDVAPSDALETPSKYGSARGFRQKRLQGRPTADTARARDHGQATRAAVLSRE